ncbi:MAG: undecaprenyl-phosphate galactose phosphotransferase WbaP [Burkholderiaceae bacterium]
MAKTSYFKGGKQRVRAGVLLLADMAVMCCAWVLAVGIALLFDRAQAADWFPLATRGGVLYILMALLVVLSLAVSGQYTRRAAFWEETRIAWRYIAMVALVNFALNFFVQVSFTRTVPLLAWGLVLGLLPFGRLAAREWMVPAGYWRRKALVVGEGANAREACAALRRERHMGVEVAGMVTLSGVWVSETDELSGMPVQLLDQDVESLARQLGCEVIVVTLDDQARGRAAQLVRSLHAQQFEVFVVPALAGVPVHGLQAQHFFSNDVLFLRLQHKLLSPGSRWLKRSIDVLVSGLLLLLLSPLMAWVAWRIRREDGAPVLYTQPRVGAQGQDFEFIKFRSMVKNADAVLQAWKTGQPELYARYEASNFKLADDPRVLKVGRWIRRTSIDELPQLWNVLRGDMSLVGPRPLLRRELPSYLPDAMELYLQVKPGITGLWQVSGRSHTTFDERSVFDSWYVRNWSLWVDWVILLKTIRVVLSGRGAM